MTKAENKKLIFITDRKDVGSSSEDYGKHLGLDISWIKTIGEATRIPQEYSPSEVENILVHRGIWDNKRIRVTNGVELAESLHEKGFRITLVTGWPEGKQETKVPLMNVLDVSDYLEKLSGRK